MLGNPSRRTRRKLEERGKRAPAVVVEIAEKGMSVTSGNAEIVSNTEVVLKTKIRVEPEDEPAFEIEDRFRYPQLSIPSVGSRLAVIYDPSDHDKVMIDRSAAGAAVQFGAIPGMQGMDLQDVMSKVKEAQSQTQDPQEMGRILAQEFGANVNVAQQNSSGMTFGAPGAGFGAPAAPEEDPVDKLAKLAELKEKGMLTDAEFESQKARILGES
jgi:putative oligomerization/nucleic acid binding protein